MFGKMAPVEKHFVTDLFQPENKRYQPREVADAFKKPRNLTLEVSFPKGTVGRLGVFFNNKRANLLSYTRELFDSSVYAYSNNYISTEARKDGSMHKAHSNILAYHNFINKVMYEGNPYYVRFIVEELQSKKGQVHKAQISNVTVTAEQIFEKEVTDGRGVEKEADRLPSGMSPGEIGPLLYDDSLQDYFNSVKGRASKVVDENGEPLVVWHGTPKAGFDVFYTQGGEKAEGTGAWFSDSQKVSESYQGDDGTLFPLFLNIRNPYVFDSHGRYWTMAVAEYIVKNEKTGEIISRFDNKADAIAARSELNAIHQSDDFVYETDMESFQDTNYIVRRAKAEGIYDGVFIRNVKDTGGTGVVPVANDFIAFLPTQIKSATDNAGTFSARNQSILFQVIGERGAAALDRARESTERLGSLAVAREMEAANEDARRIRWATGWERGADRKWRYEIPDVDDSKIKDYALSHPKEYTVDGKVGDWVTGETLTAYPSLKDIDLTVSWNGDGSGCCSRLQDDIWIEINASDIDHVKTILAHEIQHVVQMQEGFAKGGNKIEAFPLDTRKGAWKTLAEKRNQMLTPLSLTEYTRQAGFDSEDEARADYEIYLKEHKKRFKHGIPSDLDIDLQRTLARQYYRSLAGEVEARNAQTRLGLSPEERRAKLLAETEDVAREDQKVILEGAAAVVEVDEQALYEEAQIKKEFEIYRQFEETDEEHSEIMGSMPEREEARAEARRQYEEVEARYAGNPEGLRRAPNGKRIEGKFWDEHPEALVWIRTPNFKRKYFGDWEAVARYRMRRTAKGVDEAITLLKSEGLIDKPLTNEGLGITATITGKSLKEFRDAAAIKDSVSPAAHAYAVANIDYLFENAEFDEPHPDTHNRPEVKQIHRLGTVMIFEGEPVPVKITVKEYVPSANIEHDRIYCVEAVEVEKIKNAAGQPTGAPEEPHVPITAFNDKIAQLYNKVKSLNDNVSKVVDENGVPLPVFHNSSEKFREFKRGRSMGLFFAPSARDARQFSGDHLYAVFLSIKNPVVYDFAGSSYNEYPGEGYGVYVKGSNFKFKGFPTKEAAQSWIEWRRAEFPDQNFEIREDHGIDINQLARRAHLDGYDGMIARNVADSYIGDQYVAFESHQAKSATDNEGTFDIGEEDIYFQSEILFSEEVAAFKDPALAAALAAKFGDEEGLLRIAGGWGHASGFKKEVESALDYVAYGLTDEWYETVWAEGRRLYGPAGEVTMAEGEAAMSGEAAGSESAEAGEAAGSESAEAGEAAGSEGDARPSTQQFSFYLSQRTQRSEKVLFLRLPIPKFPTHTAALTRLRRALAQHRPLEHSLPPRYTLPYGLHTKTAHR
ncbi:MAG: hypothetical protein LBR16_00675, partial [Treponema sp.]|nr:hypothetical protein [Treponema sp.]